MLNRFIGEKEVEISAEGAAYFLYRDLVFHIRNGGVAESGGDGLKEFEHHGISASY
ncbi:MAG: hypothetical protein R3B93_04755 [Bacteroidia bacterium]